MSALALHAANDDFERRLRSIGADDWTKPTPCAEWDVRAVANHVVGGNRRYLLLLGGASAEATIRTREEDHLGDEPVAAFRTTADELAAAFRADGALERTVHHRFGDRSGAELLAMRVIDVAVHAWDLAVALGIDDRLDPSAVAFALANADVVVGLRDHGVFAPPLADPADDPDSSPQARLLRLTGR